MPRVQGPGFLPLAQVVRAQQADVHADYVLGIGGFDLDRIADEVRGAPTVGQCLPGKSNRGAYAESRGMGLLRAGRGMRSAASPSPAGMSCCLWLFKDSCMLLALSLLCSWLAMLVMAFSQR